MKTSAHTKLPVQSRQSSKRSTKHAQTKAPNSKERILQCAASEFLQKGWAKSSMREVAKLAGVTTGSLYFHFKNKEALFDAMPCFCKPEALGHTSMPSLLTRK